MAKQQGGGLNLGGAAKGKRYLFTAAIDKYGEHAASDYAPLTNPVFDAKKISSVLVSKFGFEPICPPIFNEDATEEGILEKLDEIELKDNDTLIVTFSGHGDVLNKEGHWAAYESKQGKRFSHISASDILSCLDKLVNAQHIFLIVDCCFPNKIFANTFQSNNAANEEDTGRSRWVLTSGRSEKVPDGNEGEHSPFAKALITVLENTSRPLNGHQLLSEIRKKLKANNDHTKQSPMIDSLNVAGHEGGDFILTPAEHSVEVPDGETLRKAFYDIKYPDDWWDEMDVFLKKINCFALKGERYGGHLFAAKRFAAEYVSDSPHFECFYFKIGSNSLKSSGLWEQLGSRYNMSDSDKPTIANAVFEQARDKICLFFLQIPHDSQFQKIEPMIAGFWSEMQEEIFKIHKQLTEGDQANTLPFKRIILFVLDKRGKTTNPFPLVQKHPIASHFMPAPIPPFTPKRLQKWHQKKSNNPNIARGGFTKLDFTKFDSTKGDFNGETTIAKICELSGLNGKEANPYKIIFEENQII